MVDGLDLFEVPKHGDASSPWRPQRPVPTDERCAVHHVTLKHTADAIVAENQGLLLPLFLLPSRKKTVSLTHSFTHSLTHSLTLSHLRTHTSLSVSVLCPSPPSLCLSPGVRVQGRQAVQV